MSDPDYTAPSGAAETGSGRRRAETILTRKCRRNAFIGVAIMALAGGVFGWREHQSDALLTRIHHGLVVCASGAAAVASHPLSLASAAQAATDTSAVRPPDRGTDPVVVNAPSMVQLDVTENTDGQLLVREGARSLSDALMESRQNRELVMLSLHDTVVKNVVKVIRATGMRHRVILSAANETGTVDALKADRSIIVAIPVTSVHDEHEAKRLAGSHPFAAYLPSDASPALFAQAHHDAAAVIADSPRSLADPARLQAFLNQPVDIVVTDNPDRFVKLLDGG
ncbi:PI-PLC domain-containing protein [Acetobacter oeni]|uniref:Uncharacterized protein n=1 Tax=Acetobacter oeni TaxID=304077 RepID=A0A511XGV2_9PROT|nr:hypothetical protein [Acetobacter oeni]MBB3881660.1 DNA-binding NarL/FixJ family response regulator [Acetobacter oeni]NHO17532.1 hypothetical protein [Acetobacter oeni]GBR06096.1 hypothetical protein AA21952_1918 [Acetobacter oeni LMG 21952]GEN62168.1 hypothetical protein AOE01nite_03920 [Acetobacter oeni]